MKDSVKGSLNEEEASIVDSITLEDINSMDKLMEKLVDKQLGPLLASAGVTEPPVVFFFELIKLALFLQFVTVGCVWYGTQYWGHYDSGGSQNTVSLASFRLSCLFCQYL